MSFTAHSLVRMLSGEPTKILKVVGKYIHRVISYILLAITYILGIAPVAIIAKIVGKHFWDTRPKADETTYWIDVPAGEHKLEEYYRQF